MLKSLPSWLISRALALLFRKFPQISCFLPFFGKVSPENFANLANFSPIFLLSFLFVIYQKPCSNKVCQLLKFYKYVLTINEFKLWLCFRKEIVTDYHQLDQ